MTSRPVSKPPGAAAAGTVVVYHGDVRLGELDTIPVTTSTTSDQNFQFPNNEIRIHHLTPQSERCSPLSVLQTISSYSVRCKLESSSPVEQPHLINLHASCFHEFKTAVVLIGDEEIHLVAMPSKEKKFPCFWCFAVPLSLYDSCLGLLNMRCLAIVFDLDETLIVANTMKSFEDRIEALRAWIARDADPMRISGMSAELKRCMEDRLLLKQYAENDCVTDNGKVFKVQLEEVPPVSDTQQERLVRPVIRLQERNIVLTRINPEIRDTSVLVRLRPAWEDLRSYLTAKGRKRFDVYVCTMAERDYALEMWRLLDPESHLISTKQLSDRVVCVKSGSRKSLLNVFHGGLCHPKMAMVIDDRAKVWEDKDQSRVHVVPPFSPYYAPQAETAHAVPVLCVARNVACNVRGYFFKEFDENFLRRIFEVSYEDEVVNLPPPPDASNYMMSEDAGFVPNGNGTAPFAEGMSGAEVERRLYHSDDKSAMDLATPSAINSPELRSEITQPTVPIIPNVGPASLATSVPSQKPSLLGAPVRRDLRTQNSGQPPILSRIPAPMSSSSSSSSIQPQGGWLVEEDICQAHPNSRPSEAGLSQNLPPSYGREFQTESGKNLLPSYMSIGVLQEIGRKCGSKVEFRPVSTRCNELEFSIEVLFTGEKIAMGMGRTRKDAQQQAADNALRNLAEKYTRHITPQSAAVDRDFNNLSLDNENGFLWETANTGVGEAVREDVLPKESTLEAAEDEARITSSGLVNNQPQKRANSPRLTQSVTNKRSKEELPHGPQSLPS